MARGRRKVSLDQHVEQYLFHLGDQRCADAEGKKYFAVGRPQRVKPATKTDVRTGVSLQARVRRTIEAGESFTAV